MPRLYLPLLPVVILAAVAAASACSKGRAGEEGDTLRVVPPPAAYAPAVSPADGAAPAPLLASGREPGRASPGSEPAPTPEEVKAFETSVGK